MSNRSFVKVAVRQVRCFHKNLGLGSVRLLLLFVLSASAQASLITLPWAGEVLITFEGGSAGAWTDFGVGTRSAPGPMIFSGIPNSLTPPVTVSLGVMPAGTELDFWEATSWGGVEYAYSSDLATPPAPRSSLVAFADTANILGYGGSCVEVLGAADWRLHLDDAASYMVDDDNNDNIIRVSVSSVPDTAGSLSLLLISLVGLAVCRRLAPLTVLLRS
jgi:hypothetical protein